MTFKQLAKQAEIELQKVKTFIKEYEGEMMISTTKMDAAVSIAQLKLAMLQNNLFHTSDIVTKDKTLKLKAKILKLVRRSV